MEFENVLSSASDLNRKEMIQFCNFDFSLDTLLSCVDCCFYFVPHQESGGSKEPQTKELTGARRLVIEFALATRRRAPQLTSPIFVLGQLPSASKQILSRHVRMWSAPVRRAEQRFLFCFDGSYISFLKRALRGATWRANSTGRSRRIIFFQTETQPSRCVSGA